MQYDQMLILRDKEVILIWWKAIGWILNRCQVKVDKKSGIKMALTIGVKK